MCSGVPPNCSLIVVRGAERATQTCPPGVLSWAPSFWECHLKTALTVSSSGIASVRPPCLSSHLPPGTVHNQRLINTPHPSLSLDTHLPGLQGRPWAPGLPWPSPAPHGPRTRPPQRPAQPCPLQAWPPGSPAWDMSPSYPLGLLCSRAVSSTCGL